MARIDGDIAIEVPPPASVNRVRAQPYVTLEDDTEVATFAVEGWVPGMDIQVDARLVVELGIDEAPSTSMRSLSELTGELLDAVATVLNVVGISFGFCEPEGRLEGHRPPRLVGRWSEHTGVASH